MELNIDKISGTGVIVIVNNNEMLLLKRGDRQGWCLPGGKVEEGEMAVKCAVRELFEESGIKASIDDLTYECKILSSAKSHGKPMLIFSNIYSLPLAEKPEIKIPDGEITDYKWVKNLDDLTDNNEPMTIFPPTLSALNVVFHKILK